MRVLLLAPAKSIHTFRWATSLVGRGCDVVVVSAHNDHVRDYPCDVTTIRPHIFDPRNISKVKDIINGWKPNVIHAHYVSSYGILANLSAGKDYVVSVWGHDVYGLSGWRELLKPLVKRALNKALMICSTSHVMARRTKALVGEYVEIKVVPFGIETNVFIANQNRVDTGVLNFGVVKSIEHKYGIDTLIKAFSIAAGEINSSTRLLIVGKGSMEANMKALASDLKIQESISFAGYIEHSELPKWFRSFDIFCCLSRDDSESFGVSSVEAMSCSLPVVLSDVDGFREVLGDPPVGILVPREDPKAAAHEMIRLANDVQLRRELGQEARQRAVAEYDWDACVDDMMSLYQSIST